jgi:hypothetical protein
MIVLDVVLAVSALRLSAVFLALSEVRQQGTPPLLSDQADLINYVLVPTIERNDMHFPATHSGHDSRESTSVSGSWKWADPKAECKPF